MVKVHRSKQRFVKRSGLLRRKIEPFSWTAFGRSRRSAGPRDESDRGIDGAPFDRLGEADHVYDALCLNGLQDAACAYRHGVEQ